MTGSTSSLMPSCASTSRATCAVARATSRSWTVCAWPPPGWPRARPEQEGGMRLVGAKVERVEDGRILTGRGRYIDDVQLPRMLHAAFVRSPFAHARIVSVDAGEARAAPGVAAVLTGE